MKNQCFYSMKRYCSFIFFLVTSYCVGFSQNYNLGFEKVLNPKGLPDGWINNGHSSYAVKIDSITKHSGSYAVLIEAIDSVTTGFGGIMYTIPARYQGKRITLKAFMKAEGDIQAASLMLIVRNDGGTMLEYTNATLNDSSIFWKEYSVSTPLPYEAKSIEIQVMLRGIGKLWVDEISVFIDNKDLSEAELKDEDERDLLHINMDKISETLKLPYGWYIGTQQSHIITIDSITKRSSKYSLSIETTDASPNGSNAVIWYRIPAKYQGKNISLNAFVKTAENNQSIGLNLIVQDENFTILANDMSSHRSSTNWKKYSTRTLPLPSNAKNILIGISLTGRGKLWADDFQILIDGKDLSNGKLKVENKADLDTEFYDGSKIKIGSYTPQMLLNLEMLCRVWGFLKYHHPAIASGDYNFEAELFRVMPLILNASDKNDVSKILLQWIDKFGSLPSRKTRDRVADNRIKLYPDLEWINNETLGRELADKLLNIRDLKRRNDNYYIEINKRAPVPIFKNEIAYSNMNFDDDGLRLLALFRYWNMIQYFFPYRYLTDNNWNEVLGKFIPKFLEAANEKDYKLTVLQLIAQINDSHAQLQHDRTIAEIMGTNRAPYNISFVDGKAVVSGYLNNDTILKTGDIIKSIDGHLIGKIVEEKLPITSASNYQGKLLGISKDLLRTNSEYLTIDVIREEETLTLTVNCLPLNSLSQNRPQVETYKLLTPDVGYIHTGNIKRDSLPQIMKLFKNTKGLIIDIRHYPDGQIFFLINDYLMPQKAEHAKITTVSATMPGRFAFMRSKVKIGKRNRDFYKGRIVVLVNENTISMAEYATMAIQIAPLVTVIGSTTAGADGNVTHPIMLPGGLRTVFTGLGVYYPDGRETQCVGIAPDIEVKPTIQGIREGHDELLEKSIEIIKQDSQNEPTRKKCTEIDH